MFPKSLKLFLIAVGLLSTSTCFYFVSVSMIRFIQSANNDQHANSYSYSNTGSSTTNNRQNTPLKSLPTEQNWYNSKIPFWGTFRPGIFFGMKTRSLRYQLSTGVMWSHGNYRGKQLQHDTNDNIRFDWIKHNGKTFGQQKIIDRNLLLFTNYILPSFDHNTYSNDDGNSASHSSGHSHSSYYNNHIIGAPSWMNQIVLTCSNNNSIGISTEEANSFLYYFGVDCPDSGAGKNYKCLAQSKISHLNVVTKPKDSTGIDSVAIYGYNKLSGWFSLVLLAYPNTTSDSSSGEDGDDGSNSDDNNSSNQLHVSFTGLKGEDVLSGSDRVRREAEGSVRYKKKDKKLFDDFGDLNNEIEEESSFIAVQVIFHTSTIVQSVLFEHLEVSDENQISSIIDSKSSLELPFTIYANDYRDTSDAADVSAWRRTISSSKSFNEKLVDDFKYWSSKYETEFNNKFDEVFQLKRLGTSDNNSYKEYVEFAQTTLSSLLGGIGYYYGAPRIGAPEDVAGTKSAFTYNYNNKNSIANRKVSLLSASPSRTVFPRGFLWDEGFHQFVVSEWDSDLTLQILSDWLNGMHFMGDINSTTDGFVASSQVDGSELATHPLNRGGWIPREMILGDEATKRVPEEFVTQRVNIANPPTLLLVVNQLLDRVLSQNNEDDKTCSKASCEDYGEIVVRLKDMQPKLHQWIQWFLHSQRGSDELKGSFRWRGRSQSDRKVVPNTLSSGLDDYPRSFNPTVDEHHVDLHCWMIKACEMMAKLEEVLVTFDTQNNGSTDGAEGFTSDTNYKEEHKYLLRRLDDLHWSQEYSGYFDVGLTADSAEFVNEIAFRCANGKSQFVDVMISEHLLRNRNNVICPETYPQPLYPLGDGNGDYIRQQRYVPIGKVKLAHIPIVGYVSIFPLLLKLLPVESPKLTALLSMVQRDDLLWTSYGLRSIAAIDQFYHRRNSAGDAPYWRGPIWLPINYLALSGLHYYGFQDASVATSSDTDTIIRNENIARAQQLYSSLRNNLIENLMKEWKRTGYLWEQYDDVSGNGIRGHPFTGWTALIVNIMTEKYV